MPARGMPSGLGGLPNPGPTSSALLQSLLGSLPPTGPPHLGKPNGNVSVTPTTPDPTVNPYGVPVRKDQMGGIINWNEGGPPEPETPITFGNPAANAASQAHIAALRSGQDPATATRLGQNILDRIGAGGTSTATAADPNTDFILGDYRRLLGRSAAPDEVSYWQKQMAGGMGQDAVTQAFQSSPEFKAKGAPPPLPTTPIKPAPLGSTPSQVLAATNPGSAPAAPATPQATSPGTGGGNGISALLQLLLSRFGQAPAPSAGPATPHPGNLAGGPTGPAPTGGLGSLADRAAMYAKVLPSQRGSALMQALQGAGH